jgi:hypothetical protein
VLYDLSHAPSLYSAFKRKEGKEERTGRREDDRRSGEK